MLGLGRGRVDDLEQDAHTDQRPIEFDVEAGEPLGGLIGEQKRRHEREILARAGSGRHHAIAAVDHGERYRDAAERLHQRAGTLAHARHLVGITFHRGDVRVETSAHGVFERIGLDDADALYRLLQGFQDARAAAPLAIRDRDDTPDELAHQQHCRWRDREGEQ